MDKITKTDVLVIGAGQAGFFAAIKARKRGVTVTLVDKGYAGKSGQSQHIETMIVFDPEKNDLKEWVESDRGVNEYMNDPRWVELTYTHSKEAWDDLASRGFESSRYADNGNVSIAPMNAEGGEYTPGLEGLGGTGEDRMPLPVKFRFIVSRQQWKLRKVVQELGIQLIDRFTVTDLIKENGRIAGAVGFSADDEDTYIFQAKAVVLTAGNGGMKSPGIRTVTTTGDAQAMAYRTGCDVTGKEWADYHPARGDFPAYSWSGGVDRDYFVPKSQNAKHHGLLVYNADGDFVDGMRPDEDLKEFTTGQIFDGARMAYEAHMGRAPTYFYVDWDPNTRPMNHSPKDMPREEVDEAASKKGMVRMAMGRALGQSHHLSDGVWCDKLDCSTQVPGLYAAGDCLGSRPGYPMAGFACTYTCVTGKIAGESAADYASGVKDFELDQAEVNRLTQIMWAPKNRHGGFTPGWVNQVIINTLTPYWVLLYKSEERMQTALNTILFIRDNLLPKLWARDQHELRKAHEVRSIVLHCEMKLRASMFRKESRWTHYREDYPLRDDENWLCWIRIRDVDGEMQMIKEPVPDALKPDPKLRYVQRYAYSFPNEPENVYEL